MPSRRRPTHAAAAALPASRLPLGTPQLSRSKSFASARTTSQSPPQLESRESTSSSDNGTKTGPTHRSCDSDAAPTMPPKHSPDATLAKSIAEAKLERQKKRIEEADAALTGHATLDKRGNPARGKGRQWKPFDYTADTSQDTQSIIGAGPPVNEVRVNTFRPPPSRDSSLARSMSALSQRSSQTGPSELERNDSTLTDNGFQVYKGRRTKKTGGELNAYEDKPDERQTTVEATFDKREIYDVFGNALPGPEFITENIGHKNGQLQFIQHPNGDVSAHQWSSDRYIWENIGQFSNIRKKVEGQLASDRLKGQTAHQTLQQNTLAYFRTIAKQREANVMGLPFGPKEIQAVLPAPSQNELAAAPTGLKETAKDTYPPELAFHDHKSNARREATEYPSNLTQSTLSASGQPFLPQNIPPGPRADRLGYTPNYRQPPATQNDPFYSASTFQQIYGGSPFVNQQHSQKPKSPPQSDQFFRIAQRPSGLNYDYNFPPVGEASRSHDTPRHVGDSGGLGPKDERLWQHMAGSQSSNTRATGPHHHQYQSTGTYSSSAASQTVHNRAVPAGEIAAPRPRHVPPSGRGTSMSDYLVKISESATERKLSQSNIGRTVLYDPYQNQPAPMKPEPQKEMEKQEMSPLLTRSFTGKPLQPPTSFDPKSSKFFPTVLTPQIVQPPSSPVSGMSQNIFQQSSSATQQDRKQPGLTVPLLATSEPEPAPQNFNGPFFADKHSSHPSSTETTSSSSSEITRTYDEELNDWWFSGSKFARQQEFFDKIKASHEQRSTAHLTPIGQTPKRTSGLAPFNETTTRLLIPVLENLASYVEGPVEKRRDYFCQWSQPPEWCIDRSERGNDSFFDSDWGQPPTRVARDPRYSNQRSWGTEPQGNRFGSPVTPRGASGFGGSIAVGGPSWGLDRRFLFGGRY